MRAGGGWAVTRLTAAVSRPAARLEFATGHLVPAPSYTTRRRDPSSCRRQKRAISTPPVFRTIRGLSRRARRVGRRRVTQFKKKSKKKRRMIFLLFFLKGAGDGWGDRWRGSGSEDVGDESRELSVNAYSASVKHL